MGWRSISPWNKTLARFRLLSAFALQTLSMVLIAAFYTMNTSLEPNRAIAFTWCLYELPLIVLVCLTDLLMWRHHSPQY